MIKEINRDNSMKELKDIVEGVNSFIQPSSASLTQTINIGLLPKYIFY